MVKRLLPFLLALCVPLLFTGSAFAEKAPFGLKSFEISATEAPTPGQTPDAFGRVLGPADVQAGSHPYKLTTTFVLDKAEESSGNFVPAGKGLKDVEVRLPPGFVGNPNATAKCNYHDFIENECPNDTVVGVATTVIGEPNREVSNSNNWYRNSVYNLETPGGVPAEFGYFATGVVPVLIDASVRTGSDYGITASVRNIPQVEQVWASTVTIWGVPADQSHDIGCALGSGGIVDGEGEPGEGLWFPKTSSYTGPYQEECTGPQSTPSSAQPLLTNPTSCGESREASISVDDWEEPGNFATEPGTHAGEKVHTDKVTLPPLLGCEALDFSPSLSVTPDGTAGSTPTGLNVGVHVPQEPTTNPNGLGEADVKETTVALPPGVQVSPSASDGLQACTGNPSELGSGQLGSPGDEIGFTGFAELNPVSDPGVQTPQFTSRLPGSIPALRAGEKAQLEPGKNFCPDASKIANVSIRTPLLEGELKGSVYLAAPQNFLFAGAAEENPFKSLIAMYLVAEEPVTGVLVKLPGEVSLNEATGQITTTFKDTPQTPFNELKLEFFGTARAPLATPAYCGTYNTESSFVPWSGEPAVHPPASFDISSGPNGSACSDPLPFSPALASGTTNNNAGAFSNLTTTLGREDGQQQIQQVTLHYPPGVSGLLAGVELCGEAQANAGTCGPNSQIGESIVSVGLGNDPFTVVGGKAYITGPYNGTSTCSVGSPGCAPFGLSIVNPAKAGPFVLQEGRPVVVRAKIEVNPTTAALTVVTNSASEAYHIPTMIEGIPLQIKHVNVLVNRPNFTFNPTSCEPMKLESTISSAEGASSTTSTPFQVASCLNLKFAPKFSVSTQGKTSKAKGASLTTSIAYPGPFNAYANIAKVKVELPEQLPSRLTTLQKACTAAQFNANPAGCPAASVIGHAKAITPLLPVPLEGPAYFVSNGGEAFPNLIMVLQGYGVTIDLVGDTFISKAGITSSTFKTVPDQPVTSFELTLPEGKYSALAANGNLCEQKLVMPTEFKAQNGAEIKQNTRIEVEGCPNTISISSHKVKGKTTTLSVYVPAAGKLTATGKGLSSVTKTYSGQEAQTFTLTQKKAGKLKTKIKLTFTPSGKSNRQSKSLTVEFKR